MGWNCLRAMALVPIALAIGAMSASAAPILVTFDNDPVDIPGNYFTSQDSSLIHFVDTVIGSPQGGEMSIFSAPFTNNSNALAIGFDDDDSELRIVLDILATSISMDLYFGDRYVPLPGDAAVLTAYREGAPVGTPVSADLLAQGILFDGVVFDEVVVGFVVGKPGGLTEFVDNVNVTPIPEPHAAVVFGAGALLVGAACGRRSRAEVGLHAKRR